MVKCRVTPKNGGSAIVVIDENVKGPLRVGALVEVRHNSSNIEATINKIMDGSQYTVVFDDGDETTLKRTSLCLKSGKHYSESESLDHLPLTNPEQFCNPVGLWPRKRRRPGDRSSNTPIHSNRDSASIPYSNPPSVSDEDSTTGTIDGDDDSASNLTQRSVAKDCKDDSDCNSLRKDETLDIGKVFIIEYGEKRGNKAKDVWYPALVVNPTTPENSTIKIDPEHEYLVKSFKDNKFYCVPRRDVKEFDQETYCSPLNDSNSSAALRSAVDKSIAYLERGDLPSTWDSDLLLGPFASSDSNVATNDADTNFTGIASSESDSVADEDYDDDKDKYEQPSELKDRFVAQLYKYMDERGTPINKAPSVNGKDLDLYRLFNIVHEMGGYNRVTVKESWRQVYFKADLPSCPTQTLENNAINALKAAYKKYLLNFTDFYKKLGLSSSFVSSPSSGRVHRRFGNWKGNTASSSSTATTTGQSDAHVTNAPTSDASNTSKSRRKSTTDVDIKCEPNDDSQECEKLRPDDDDKSCTRRGSLKKQPKKTSASARKKGPANKSETSTAAAATAATAAAATAAAIESDDGMSESSKTPGPSVESDTDSELSSVQSIGKDVEVNVGDKIRVKYSKGSGEHVYEAKVLKTNLSKPAYWVHYNGWNIRYDEWIPRSRIIEVIREKSPRRRSGNASNKMVKRGPPPNDANDASESKIAPSEPVNTPKRGRPPSASGSRGPTDATKNVSISSSSKVTQARNAAASTASGTGSLKKLRSRIEQQQSDTEQSDSSTIVKDDKSIRSQTCTSETATDKSGGPSSIDDDIDVKGSSSERRSSVESSVKIEIHADKDDVKCKKDSTALKDTAKDQDSNDSGDDDNCSKIRYKRKRKERKITHDETPKKKVKGLRGTTRNTVKDESPPDVDVSKSKERSASFSSKKRKLGETPLSPVMSVTDTIDDTTDGKQKRKRGLTKESILRADAKHKAEAARKASEKSIKKNTLITNEDDSRPDDEDVNLEIARLFNEDKDKQQVTQVCSSKKDSNVSVTCTNVSTTTCVTPSTTSSSITSSSVASNITNSSNVSVTSNVKSITGSPVIAQSTTTNIVSSSNSKSVTSTSNCSTGINNATNSINTSSTCNVNDTPEVSTSFLLCEEKVPMSPLPTNTGESTGDVDCNKMSSSSSSTGGCISSGNNNSSNDTSNVNCSSNNTDNNNVLLDGNNCNNNNTNNNSSTNFSPPTTPESLRSGTLSSLTPPHERESQDNINHNNIRQNSTNRSTCNSDGEGNDCSTSSSTLNRQKVPCVQFGSPSGHDASDDSNSHSLHDNNTNNSVNDTNICLKSKSKHIIDGQSKCNTKDTLTCSPKRKRRGRARTSSTSEVSGNSSQQPLNQQQQQQQQLQDNDKSNKKSSDKHAGYKTRGSSNKRGANRSSGYHEHDRYSPIGSTGNDHVTLHPISPVSGISLADYTPNAFFKDIHPTSKYNFCTPIDEELDADRRIQIINERICDLRKTYITLKSDLQSLERRRKKLKRKDRSNGCSPRSENHDRMQKNLDRSVSGEFSSDASDLTRPANDVNID